MHVVLVAQPAYSLESAATTAAAAVGHWLCHIGVFNQKT